MLQLFNHIMGIYGRISFYLGVSDISIDRHAGLAMNALRQDYEARIVSKREQVQKVIESERSLLSNIMDNLPDAVFITNEHGQYMLSNKAHYTLLGYRHEY
jgi:PAS domain-containing protein